MQLDLQWLAIKEAAIPGLLGLAILISTRTRFPLIRTLLYNPRVMNTEEIQQKLEALGNHRAFEARLLNANYLLSGTFFFSSLMNYILAKWIVTSPTGSTAFNEELGQMTLMSYPYAWAFFVPFILIATFTMLNLFIAIIVNAMQSYSEAEHQETVQALQQTQEHIEMDLHKEMQSLRSEIKELKQLLVENLRSHQDCLLVQINFI